jgi:GalNAc-alpha-(1->4)-GalNAc-alpha-(1->3)-diNAcBac-PP-undecaprenol alpha-1,4-N-acetyl-D-galactosaminyltransferase
VANYTPPEHFQFSMVQFLGRRSHEQVETEQAEARMKITFVISSLDGGGAERVVSNMARYWADKNWEITILTLFHGRRPVCYDLHPKVMHRDLVNTALCKNPRPDAQSLVALRDLFNILTPSERKVFLRDINLIVSLRHAIISTKPQTVISFIDVTNIYVLLALYRLNLPTIISERCHPVSTGDKGWDRLRQRLYPRATNLVVLAEESLSCFEAEVRKLGRVIPNAVLPPHHAAADEMVRQPTSERILLAMGRLAYEKGFDLLLRAFANIAQKHPLWSLNIFGQGPLRSELRALADELGLSERVRFPGFTHQPFEVMRQSDLFVLSSRLEGFPNVLLEAMACGLPVVSFACPTGPSNIVRDGTDGLLAPPFDVVALTENLDRLMGDDAERKRLASRAPEVIERFSIERVMGIWENLVRGSIDNPPYQVIA